MIAEIELGMRRVLSRIDIKAVNIKQVIFAHAKLIADAHVTGDDGRIDVVRDASLLPAAREIV